MHIFTSKCAPPTFLKVQQATVVKLIARPAKFLMEEKSIYTFIRKLNNMLHLLNRADEQKVARAISFLNISTLDNQHEVFKIALKAARQYDSNPRLMALTMNMDKMDSSCKPEIPYTTQLQEVFEIKKFYPDNFFPFLSIDPRVHARAELTQWVDNHLKKKINNKPVFSGIKIYPALGFFPFDPLLDDFYQFAQENKIPLLFHCTRFGSKYIGKDIQNIIPANPDMIMPPTDSLNYAKAHQARERILERIQKYYDNKWVKNNKRGANDHACDLLSHPENYIPLLCKYPNLKVCLAHMGGGVEVEHMHLSTEQLTQRKFVEDSDMRERWAIDINWAIAIRDMMRDFPSLYTDISSTISSLDKKNVLNNIKEWMQTPDLAQQRLLGDNVLFGSDFFMTEIHKPEEMLYSIIKKELPQWFDKMAGENINRYLEQ